jgi:FkbM family methyltransferase
LEGVGINIDRGTFMGLFKKLIKLGYRKSPEFLKSKLKDLFYPYYGQKGEDVLLQSFFEPNYQGFYVDIGAFDPMVFSNTKHFYDRGWRGINIDANPYSIAIFNKKRNRDINVESGVSDVSGELNFYSFGKYSSIAAMNTFDEDAYKLQLKKGFKIEEIRKVKVGSINDILGKYLPQGQHIDFIDIDVEGFEIQILKTFNFEKYAPDYFLIEDPCLNSTGGRGGIYDFMEFSSSPLYKLMHTKGYIVVAKAKYTIIFALKSLFP